MDIATIIGLIVGFGAVIGGQLLEGGNLRQIMQPTAALIVLGGTIGATFVSFPLKFLLQAVGDVRIALFPTHADPAPLIKDIMGFASKARKNGLISLEPEVQKTRDRFLRKGLSLVVDGIDPQKLKETMEIELNSYEEHAKGSAEVFEAAGGYAPTIGIIGAVLGLIQVMNNLSDSSKLGEGIAVAFVATIYGLMVANIVCIPLGTKLKLRLKEEILQKEMIIEGLMAIQNGDNPHFIEQRLNSFIQHEESPQEKKGSKRG